MKKIVLLLAISSLCFSSFATNSSSPKVLQPVTPQELSVPKSSSGDKTAQPKTKANEISKSDRIILELSKEIKDLEKKQKEQADKNKNNESLILELTNRLKYSTNILLLTVVFGVLLFLISIYYINKGRKPQKHNIVRKYIKDVVTSSNEIKEKLQGLPKNQDEGWKNNTQQSYNDKIIRANKEIETLKYEIETIKKNIQLLNKNETVISNTNDNIYTKDDSNKKEIIIEPNVPIQYLTDKSGKTFRRITENPTNCFFEIFNIKNDNASYKFSGDQKMAIDNFNAVFDEVCDTEGSIGRARSITNVSEGKIRKINDKWEVIKPAKVKFNP